MTKNEILEQVQDFVSKHRKFPTKKDIPSLPSLRTLQRYGIKISDFIEKKPTTKEQIKKMQESSQKILDSVSELAFLLHNKGYSVQTNHVVFNNTNKRVNIICTNKKDLKKYAIEIVCPSSKLSVPTSIPRRIFKFNYDSLDEYENVFIVNINETFNIGYYKPRFKMNPKIKLINLSQLPLWN